MPTPSISIHQKLQHVHICIVISGIFVYISISVSWSTIDHFVSRGNSLDETNLKWIELKHGTYKNLKEDIYLSEFPQSHGDVPRGNFECKSKHVLNSIKINVSISTFGSHANLQRWEHFLERYPIKNSLKASAITAVYNRNNCLFLSFRNSTESGFSRV